MTPMIPQVPFNSTRPAALPELLELAAAADAEGRAVGDELPLAPEFGAAEADPEEEEAEDILAGPEEVEDVELDMVAFPLALALALMLELELPLAEAGAEGLAARLAVPPPMVEKGVHCEVAPAGCGAGVVGSP